ncbi:tetratricopeptide repeat protein [Oscillatoria sp. FACHB-1406]|uniref:tetratricopeptide repeat protein n=1 Tax=Oscillatoria sp. FACHB-1406 TaxID=2692846 RepID=UPI00168249E0|nr:tetratricopeptide repeat protein [Oscillatoria sp. FACHB-1406]MBD2577326.1 tetratricopeptide repeat protein [Oscillatoria sp. FACHB-1406]
MLQRWQYFLPQNYPAALLALVVATGGIAGYSHSVGAQLFDDPLYAPTNNGTQGSSREEADRLVRFGGEAEKQRQYRKAIDYWLQAADIYQRLGETQALGQTYDFLGMTYLKLDRIDAAERYLRMRLGVARDRNDFRGQIFGYNNVGTILLQYDNFQGAETAFREALAIAESIDSNEGEGLSRSNLGLLAVRRGNYIEAIKQYESAIQYRRRASDPLGEINSRNGLGDAYFAAGNYKEAQISYGIARQLAREAIDPTGSLNATIGLARAYLAGGKTEAALTELKRWAALAKENGQPDRELIALRLTGQVYHRMGDWTRAYQFFQQALESAVANQDTQQEAFLRNEIERVLYRLP